MCPLPSCNARIWWWRCVHRSIGLIAFALPHNYDPPLINAPVPRAHRTHTSRFEKNDILRIVRALAIVRPSFIALQMPMTEEDEVFVEKCFQRSLIELDKLVSFSGTPTVAWRRTGEICLVGPEFCMLTGWEREELVGKRKYIYEVRVTPVLCLSMGC